MRLSISKVNDGICDCCDGSDERNNDKASCLDNCDEVLAEERAKREKAVKDFEIGHAKRNKEIADFQAKVNETLDKVAALEAEIGTLQTDHLTSQIESQKLSYSHQRLATAKDLVTSGGGDGGSCTGIVDGGDVETGIAVAPDCGGGGGGGGGGIEEAPNDGNYYVRQNNAWVDLTTALSALGVPTDGTVDGGIFTP